MYSRRTRRGRSRSKNYSHLKCSMETKLYNEKHTKAVLDAERMIVNRKVNDIKRDNGQMSREISRNKMFNKKDEDRKAKKEQMDKLQAILKDYNKVIEEHDIMFDKERRVCEDRDLIKKQQLLVNQLKQESSKVHIDISIADSRVKDLINLKEMTLGQIKETLAEKQKIDKDNADIQAKIEGRGMTEQEQKQRQFEAEQEQIKKIKNSLKFQKEFANNVMERLKKEEKEAKDMLDEKINQQQNLTRLTEDLNDARALAARNREEIIKLQIKFS